MYGEEQHKINKKKSVSNHVELKEGYIMITYDEVN